MSSKGKRKSKAATEAPVTEPTPTEASEPEVTVAQLAAVVEGEAGTESASAPVGKPSTKGMNLKVAKATVREWLALIEVGETAKVVEALNGLIVEKVAKGKKERKFEKMPVAEAERLRQIEAKMIEMGYTTPTVPLAETPREEPAELTEGFDPNADDESE